MTVIELITCIRQHKKASLAILVLILLLGKIASVPFGMHGVGTFEGERNDILRRRNYLFYQIRNQLLHAIFDTFNSWYIFVGKVRKFFCIDVA